MRFRLLQKSVTLNDLERRNVPYFVLRQHRTRIRYTIRAIIQQLFGQNKLITRFDGRRCI